MARATKLNTALRDAAVCRRGWCFDLRRVRHAVVHLGSRYRFSQISGLYGDSGRRWHGLSDHGGRQWWQSDDYAVRGVIEFRPSGKDKEARFEREHGDYRRQCVGDD